MERPQHELMKIQTKSASSRAFSIGIVIGLHILIVIALVIGLTNNAIRNKIVDISASVVAKHVITAAPPPPPVQIVRPPPVAAAPPPQIVISAPPPAVVQKVVAPPPPPPPAPTELKEITRTHTIPPYPALSQRMGESGTTGLSCEIEVTGRVSSCKVDKSSGSGRLDEAASSYVKDHYTWQPPTREGKPVTATAHLNIVWDLKNAQ